MACLETDVDRRDAALRAPLRRPAKDPVLVPRGASFTCTTQITGQILRREMKACTLFKSSAERTASLCEASGRGLSGESEPCGTCR